ncbi:MAG: undecaprenyl-diphosphate phosphatase [Puniceicoccales bacterium]|jgi:undecaprenyl-diphosphatase|nr:undecaprenyl-diphosphate phosphatase [Puniceicoccales bacterium]
MKKFFFAICLHLLAATVSCGNEIFTTGEIIALGVTQGATEFLPISSTAHLIVVDKFFPNREIDSGTAQAELESEAKGSYFSIIQLGSVFAVLFLYRRRFLGIALGVFHKNPSSTKIITNLIISFLPAAVVGCLIDGWVQKTLYGGVVVAVALVVGAGIMVFFEIINWKCHRENFTTIENLIPKKSLAIGLWQCLALIPGMSRAMTTIVGGHACGLRRSEAAEYSFLLGAMTLTAASVYKFTKDFRTIFACLSIKSFFLGIVVAFAVSVVSLRLLVLMNSRGGMILFAFYRIVLAAVVFYSCSPIH